MSSVTSSNFIVGGSLQKILRGNKRVSRRLESQHNGQTRPRRWTAIPTAVIGSPELVGEVVSFGLRRSWNSEVKAPHHSPPEEDAEEQSALV